MIKMFFEVIARASTALAKATWFRYPNVKYKKIKWTISYLRWLFVLYFLICISPRRGILFSALYGWFRPADDILDGDDPNPPKDISNYISRKNVLIRFLECDILPASMLKGEDRLLLAILYFAKSLGILDEVMEYVPTIWKHMVDDYTWKTTSVVPSSYKLYWFACSQDEAIFRLAALVFGVDKEAFAKIDILCLGAFTRTDWITDLESDLRSGLVHLSKESILDAGLDYHDITFKNFRVARDKLGPSIKTEVLATDKLWQQVNQHRGQLVQAFRFKTLGRLYDRFMIGWIWENHRQNMRRFCR